MKKVFYLFMAAITFTSAACEKDKGGNNCDLPSTPVPSEVAGKWVNGYTSFTQVIDAYNGRILGTTWKSGRYMELNSNGKNAVLYIMAGSMNFEAVTKVEGNVTLDEDAGTLKFHVCKAWYKGWQYGNLKVDRAATDSETAQLTENLQFYYGFETSGGTNYLQLFFDPQGSPTSFRRAD